MNDPDTIEAVIDWIADENRDLILARCSAIAKTAIAADRRALADAGYEIVPQAELKELRDIAALAAIRRGDFVVEPEEMANCPVCLHKRHTGLFCEHSENVEDACYCPSEDDHDLEEAEK